jgi:hypothetical protein
VICLEVFVNGDRRVTAAVGGFWPDCVCPQFTGCERDTLFAPPRPPCPHRCTGGGRPGPPVFMVHPDARSRIESHPVATMLAGTAGTRIGWAL